jgi:hypothetical protein
MFLSSAFSKTTKIILTQGSTLFYCIASHHVPKSS